MEYDEMHSMNFTFVSASDRSDPDYLKGHDTAIIELEDGELDEFDEDDLGEFSDELKEIFDRHVRDLAGLVSNFVSNGERITISEYSVLVTGIDPDAYQVHFSFEETAEWGCSNLNYHKEKDCSIPFEVDLERRRIVMRVEVSAERDTIDEI